MNTSANNVIDRLALIFEAKNDSDLCKYLGLARTTLSTWRGRDSVPYAICVQIAQEKGISLDWLLAGEGPMYRNQVAEVSEGYTLDQRHTNLLALFDAVTDEQQREILAAAQEKERLNRLEEQLGALAKKLG
ncbi:helix-turn-helix domain containing protein [Methylomonas sp. SURF-2]|uniref:Helix-turn-helix domain containing protein n=1 Tax=Methylomonas subterranea TaxID=2952225 RepID=A0ABT1TCT5_9GAMM|nr:helix-turn-helix transcriptional regulator [Methylomonas sp. SURF-2]MCQ8103268.1 helix-turn-helix domain containing protein [Methylomonas sp. SURF-2]